MPLNKETKPNQNIKLCWQFTSDFAWLLFNQFKQGLIFHKRFTWPWFIFEAWTAITSTIKQDQVGLKPWIQMPHSKPLWQIQWRARREYQVSTSSHSPLWLVVFKKATAKASFLVELDLTLLKYCWTFDSSKCLFPQKHQELYEAQ